MNTNGASDLWLYFLAPPTNCCVCTHLTTIPSVWGIGALWNTMVVNVRVLAYQIKCGRDAETLVQAGDSGRERCGGGGGYYWLFHLLQTSYWLHFDPLWTYGGLSRLREEALIRNAVFATNKRDRKWFTVRLARKSKNKVFFTNHWRLKNLLIKSFILKSFS